MLLSQHADVGLLLLQYDDINLSWCHCDVVMMLLKKIKIVSTTEQVLTSLLNLIVWLKASSLTPNLSSLTSIDVLKGKSVLSDHFYLISLKVTL